MVMSAQEKSRSGEPELRGVSISNGAVKKGLAKKTTFEARKAEPCWEHHSRQREQEARRPRVLRLMPVVLRIHKGGG